MAIGLPINKPVCKKVDFTFPICGDLTQKEAFIAGTPEARRFIQEKHIATTITSKTDDLPITESDCKSVAFAFDIDGVLVQGKNPIPGARDTLRYLQTHDIPFMFLTNSGGVTEKENLDKLSMRLGDITFDENQIVQSHTPFRGLVEEYDDKTVLVLGGHGDHIRHVAHAYGFKYVVTSSDIMVQNEGTHPFSEMIKEHHKKYGRKSADGEPAQVACILIWSSPGDWVSDIQITLDLLLSRQGVIGTRSVLNGKRKFPNNGYLQDGQPKIYFSNPELMWKTNYEEPRMAQGAFRETLLALWNANTDSADLDFVSYGKPTTCTYRWGEAALRKIIDNAKKAVEKDDKHVVYMIGDSTACDIAGGNSYESQCGYEWKTVLVETGVYRAGTLPSQVPNHIAKDVQEAVKWALAQHGHDVKELALSCGETGR